jgi:hypothetical protein
MQNPMDIPQLHKDNEYLLGADFFGLNSTKILKIVGNTGAAEGM